MKSIILREIKSFFGLLLYARNKIIIFEKFKIMVLGISFVNMFKDFNINNIKLFILLFNSLINILFKYFPMPK